MNKPTGVGIRYIASGLAAIAVVGFILRMDISAGVVAGVVAGVMAGVMAAMVILASHHAYKLGKKDGMSAAQQVEEDRTNKK